MFGLLDIQALWVGQPVQEHLIRTDIASGTPDDRLLNFGRPRFLPLVPDFRIRQSCSPCTAEDGRRVVRMIAHEVERFSGLGPLFHGRDLSPIQMAVEIARDVKIHLHKISQIS